MNHKLRLKWTLILIFGLYISYGNVKYDKNKVLYQTRLKENQDIK